MSPHAIARGLRRLFRRDQAEADLRDEVEQYLELAIEEHVRAGLSRAEATRRARLEFGGVEAAKEGVRSAGWDGAVDTLRRDIEYGIRSLRRNPGFTVIAVVTLALGIGANTAMFSVVNAVMLRPLPYRDAGRLALIWTDDRRRGLHQEATAYRTIQDWRADNRTFQSLAFYHTERATLIGAGARERTRRAYVSANVFPTLGVTQLIGRPLTADDEASGARVAVISHSLWQRRFGGDSAVIGKTLQIEGGGKGGGSLQIVGVMPASFYFPDKQTEIWAPATTYWRFGRESGERFSSWARRWTAVGRLKSGASHDDARADLDRIGARLTQAYLPTVPDFPGFAPNLMPVLDQVAGRNLQSALWVLLGAVGLVLLVACVNVANLLLARGASRQQEFAIRGALGAGRSRLVRQLVTESMVLAVAGGVIGTLLAFLVSRLLAAVAASQLPRIEEITIDASVLAFAAGATVLAGCVFAIIPALRVSAADATEVLKEGGRSGGSVGLRRTRGLLVVAECAIAIVLLAGAGLMLRSLDRLHAIDPGYDPAGVLSMRIEFPPDATPAELEQPLHPDVELAHRREQLMDGLMRRVATLPGVEAVGMMDDMFIAGQANGSITIPGRERESSIAGELGEGYVTAGLFEAMHVPLRQGRYLTREDVSVKIRALWGPVNTDGTLAEKERLAIPEPVVVNESFARRFFGNESPIGKRFCIDPTNKTYWYVIVGVVGDMRRSGLDRLSIPEYFGAYYPTPSGRADLFIRTKGDPLAAVGNIRQIVTQSVPGMLIAYVTTADRQLDDFNAQRNLQTWLLAAFAGLALALAAIGVYGVVHYGVAERTREIGVRIALGARPTDVMRLIIGQGMRTPVIGIAIGLAGAFASTRVLSHLLFGVEPTDPATFGGVAAALTVVAAAACYFPARGATRVDAVKALRQE